MTDLQAEKLKESCIRAMALVEPILQSLENTPVIETMLALRLGLDFLEDEHPDVAEFSRDFWLSFLEAKRVGLE